MPLCRVSAGNIATVYNYSIAPAGSRSRMRSHLSSQLSYKAVLDAFFLHALLRDHTRRDDVLCLPHAGSQETRFNTALRNRSARIRRDGQEMWDHACDDCCKFLDRSDGTKGIIMRCFKVDVCLPMFNSSHYSRCHRRRHSGPPMLFGTQLPGTTFKCP